MTRVRASLLVLLLVALAGVLSSTAVGPVQAQTPHPTLGAPVGANDWSCHPTVTRPDPAVIVHGTFGDRRSLLNTLSLSLKRDGFCVYSLDYGNRATGPIQQSARQLRDFVGRVLVATGAVKVEIVGHSQGGVMPRYYIKNLGGAAYVEDLVGLAAPNHGTIVSGGFTASPYCVACDQQRAGSAFLTALNHPDETPGAVDYTQVATTHDQVVVPYTSAFLDAGAHSTNITLQARCPADPTEHLSIPMDRQAIGWVLDAFHREGPADAHARIGCLGRVLSAPAP